MKSVLSKLKRYISQFSANQGRRITRYPLREYLENFGIDCVLDVGANIGQFGSEIRSLGYTGKIDSFEPLSTAMLTLQSLAENDPLWTPYPFALGSGNESMDINVSANSPSSSFLPLNAELDTGSIDLSTVSTETVQIKKLDDVFADIVGDARNIYLKVDTQGYESSVLDGAEKSLPSIAMVQMELSLVTNYDGEMLIEEMMQRMRSLGFTPWWLLDGFRHPGTLQLFQADVFFVRNDLIAAASKIAG